MTTTPKRRSAAPAPSPAIVPDRSASTYRWLLWLVVGLNSVFLIWQCLDRYLAPRFLLLSVLLLGGFWTLRRTWRERADWRLSGFDGLLLAWYVLNVASIAWAWSTSEAVFFSQKVLLLVGAYWLFKQALHEQEGSTYRTLAKVTVGLTWAVSAILVGQLLWGFQQNGLDNEALYAYASAVFGNKGLASDFLFFLLIFNLLFKKEIRNRSVLIANVLLLLALILVLQTRTVYLATVVAALWYTTGRAVLAPDFRQVLVRRVLPIGLLLATVAGGLVVWKGQGSSLAERLNPATYLESASANERRFVWYKTELLCADHPWLGVGNGSWKIWLPSKSLQGAYRLQEKGIVFTRAHNDYLEVRAELGWVGFTLFVLLFVSAVLGLIWALRFRRSDPHLALVTGAGLAGYCLIQYLDFPRERIEMQVVLALLFALSVHLGGDFWRQLPGAILGKPAQRLLGGAIFILLIFNVIVGVNRVSGEIHNVRMVQAYQANNNALTLREGAKARNAFYEFNDVALPLWWFDGVAYYRQKDLPHSVEALEKAYQLNPWSFQVLNNYATALAASKRFQEAIPLFEKAVDINPRYDEGKFNLAYSYVQLGNFQQALDWVAKADTIPNPQTNDERQKNRAVLQTKTEFEASIRARMQ